MTNKFTKTKLKYVCDSYSSNLSKDQLSDEKLGWEVYGADGLVGYYKFYPIKKEYLGIIKDGAGVGRINHYHKNTLLLGTMAYIFPKKGINIKWLKYCIESLDLAGSLDKTTIPHIYFSDYGNLNIYLPNKEYQEKIAIFLDNKCDRIDSIILENNSQIKKLNEYKKSLIFECVTKGFKTSKLVDSKIQWLGKIPNNWRILKNKYVFNLNKEVVNSRWQDLQLLSLTKTGVKEISPEQQSGKVPSSFSTYQLVKKEDIIMCLFDLDVSAVFSGISNFNGMISPAYKCLKCKSNILPRFADYFFRMIFDGRKYMIYSRNVRFSLPTDDFLNLPILVPPTEEQNKIINYLDSICNKIDNIINMKNDHILKLLEYKKSLIYEYVMGKVRL